MREEHWYQDFVDEKNIILTGGVVASLIQCVEPNDWDFYFTDYDAMKGFQKGISAEYFKQSIQDVDPKYTESVGQDGKMITTHAITMDNKASFITMMVGNADEIRGTFDYVHCMPYYKLSNNTLYISKQQFDACRNKHLIVNNASRVKEHRILKFLKRGYKEITWL